jgi:hypothetical protein
MIMPSNPHPVLYSLQRWAQRGKASPAERAVLAYGRPFNGIARPKGYRPRALKRCYQNAGDLALQERGTYVEGFAIDPSTGVPAQHAWLTLNGTDAVDVTWRTPATECYYFGIRFSNEVLRRFTVRTGTWGPLLQGEELEWVLREAGLRRPTRHQKKRTVVQRKSRLGGGTPGRVKRRSKR